MRLAILLFAFLTLAHPAAFALPEAKPETDAQKAVRYTAALEAEPLAAAAREQRKWLMGWLEATPDYVVTVCDVFGSTLKEDAPYAAELMAQQMFGNFAYQITLPGVHDEVSKQAAGMESALKAYSAILAAKPKAHIPYYDGLLAEQAKGTLKQHLAPVIDKACTQKT